jgi:hypothetical protein
MASGLIFFQDGDDTMVLRVKRVLDTCPSVRNVLSDLGDGRRLQVSKVSRTEAAVNDDLLDG